MWRSEYNIDIAYSVLNRSWQISGTITNDLLIDLKEIRLPTKGNFRENSNLSILEKKLNNEEKIKRFIAGLTDTIGSLAKSHRHRVESLQIISYELTGKNFILVSQLIRLFVAIKCFPDQILWNHPNFHSGTDRYYSSWKKGFKIRITLTDYMLAGSFVSEAKQLSANENMALQKASAVTYQNTDTIKITGRSTLHVSENSEWLPENIRGKHFVHYAHLGYCLGIPINDQSLEYLKNKLKTPEKLINPFTILTKGKKTEIMKIISNEAYLRETKYVNSNLSFSEINLLNKNSDNNILGSNNDKGFPISQIVHAITYVALSQMKDNGIKGKRILGDRVARFYEIKPKLEKIGVRILMPDRGTCLLIESEDYAALVGYTDNDFNSTLLELDGSKLVLKVRTPQFSECVVL